MFLLLDRGRLPHLVSIIRTISVVYNSLDSLFLPVCSDTIGLKVPTGPGGGRRYASAEAAGRREDVSAAEDFAQYKLQFVDYIQLLYRTLCLSHFETGV